MEPFPNAQTQVNASQTPPFTPGRCGVFQAAMSALGHKRTVCAAGAMSALPPKADMCAALAHVCFGSEADICAAKSDVRFTPKSGHVQCNGQCPLWAKSRHPHRFATSISGRAQCGGMPSNFGIELRSLTQACCERTNICRRGTNSFRWCSDPSRTL